jgi:hypothetical protein
MSEGQLLQPGEGELHTLGPSSKATLNPKATLNLRVVD